MIPPPPSSPPPEAAAGVGGQSSNMKEEKDSFFDDDDAKSTASKDEDSMGGDGDYDDINDDSLSGSGSSGRNNHTSTAGKESYREGLAKEETKAIKRLKCGLVFFLLIVAAAIAAVVYIYTDNVQQSEFESDFIEQATKLVEGFSSDSYQKMQALESLSKALNLHATASSSSSDNNTTKTTTKTWPFVTIPNSHDFFQPFLSLANAASIRIQPIVEARQRIQWYQHVSSTQDWIDHDLQKRGIVSSTGSGRSLQTEEEEDDDSTTSSSSSSSFTTIDINEENYRVSPYIKNYVGVDTSPNYWVPWWQYAPVIKNKWFINFNLLADGEFMRDFEILKTTKKAIIAKTVSYKPGLDFQSTRDLNFLQELLQAGGYGQYESGEPIGFIHYPVFGSSSSDHHDDDNDDNENVVAVITATVYWKTYFQNILPTTTTGIICVVENDIQTFTYRIDGNEAKFLGMEDLHDINYNQYEITSNYKSFESDFASSTNTTTTTTSTTTTTNTGQRYTGVSVDETRLAYRIRVYPSKEFQEPFDTNEPWMYAFVAGAIMLLAVFFFLIYDWYVERRQNKVSNVAVNANAIVSSLFPASVKDKLLNQQQQDKRGSNNNNNNNNNNSNAFKTGNNPMTRMSQALTGGGKQQQDVNIADYDDEDDDDGQQDTFGGVRSSRNIGYESAPIADFFPSATVLFMDIAGFTAWSSSREPSQVFILLETIYRSFDKIASRRGVFKVETIGDCYVAVCGLPEPCNNHAPKMATFARDCLRKMNQLVHKLEPRLGPDTGDLTVRTGLHSGPVTAGVLRGERARFQLFGDTVNTASRMESTGRPGMIQVSQECAELITEHGKSAWLRERPDRVEAKGKGELKTFWLLPQGAVSLASMDSSNRDCTETTDDSRDCGREDPINYMTKDPEQLSKEEEIRNTLKLQRLVRFNYDLLLSAIKQIMRKHDAQDKAKGRNKKMPPKQKLLDGSMKEGSCLDEVAEIIELPSFDQSTAIADHNEKVAVPAAVKTQLRFYCEAIAESYNQKNPFHNYDHACHVLQSASKLFSRIAAVKELGGMEQAHDTTFGITSDPLTHVAVIFAAMIHDVDHPGVTNNILSKEQPEMAEKYENHAVAEQNSLEIAWNLLMNPKFADLRCVMFHNDEAEMNRFRQLLVNCLMATDIFDKHLKGIREQRWERAFYSQEDKESESDKKNRKATIVIEHIIQASDVSHCMQHWHVFRKWNEKLFWEMHAAFKQGRTTDDPTKGWYEGELWFFDNYVIPLAKKLDQCGVFGVSSDEYLIYAQGNREEWEKKGKAIVKDYLDRIDDTSEKMNENPELWASHTNLNLGKDDEVEC